MKELDSKILDLAKKYQEYTAKNLSKLIKIKSLSTEEKEVQLELKRQMEEAGFDEVKIDGLGNVIGRIGNGSKILAIDGHMDTVDMGTLENWDFDPLGGEIKDGFVHGRGTVDQEGGPAAFVTSGNFMVDVWDGDEWKNVLSVSDDSPAKGSNEIATTSIIDVSDHINSAFKVRFVYDDENTRTYGVAIDNYKLINTAENSGGFVYYPNPVNDDLNIRARENISIINVYNAIGQLVMSKRPSEIATKLEMGTLASGMYLVQLEAGTLKENFKVFKK